MDDFQNLMETLLSKNWQNFCENPISCFYAKSTDRQTNRKTNVGKTYNLIGKG